MIPSVPILFNKISTIICDGSFLWFTHNSCDMMNMRGKLWNCIKKKVTGSCSHSHLAKLLSRPTSLNIGLGLFLFTSDHFILFFTKSHVRRLIFLVQIFLYQICDKRQHVMYNVQCWAKKMMYRQEQSISLTSFLSWFKLDRKYIYNWFM